MGIPEHLRPVLGKREFFFSLRTKDRAEAKRRILQVEAPHYTVLLEKAEAELAGHQRAAPAFDPLAGMTEDAVAAMFAEDPVMAAKEARREELGDYISFLKERLQGSTEQMPRELRAFRYILEGHDFDRELLKDQLTIARYERRELEGRLADSEASNPSPTSSQSKPSVSLTALFDAYAKTGRLTAPIVKEWGAGVARFVTFVGHDDARRVTQEDVLRWRNHARDEPQRNGKPRSPQRVNAGYLAPLRAAFKHGMSEMLIEHDPAAAVPKLLAVRQAQTRDRQFTKEEQRTILSAALNVGQDEGSPLRGLVRRWVPWLCAYTGARVNEITQLRAKDVQQIDGIWIIQITPDAGTVKSKTFRNVPVHEHLIAQGFLKVVEAQGTGPIFYDPEKGDADSERGQNKKAGERLAAWVRGLGVTDPGIMPNHAWRHTFTSRAMDAGMDERAADYIKGHASVGVSRKTYTHHSIGPLAKEMALFPRYDIE
jgi:integrase